VAVWWSSVEAPTSVFTQVPPVRIRQFHPVTADKVVRRSRSPILSQSHLHRWTAFNRLQGAKVGFLLPLRRYLSQRFWRSQDRMRPVPANIDRFLNSLFFRSSWNALLIVSWCITCHSLSDLFVPLQSGFRQGHSTETAAVQMLYRIVSYIRINKQLTIRNALH